MAALVLGVSAVVGHFVTLSPAVVTGPKAWAIAVAAYFSASWSFIWFSAQSMAPTVGVIPTISISAVAVAAVFGGTPVSTAILRLSDRRVDVPDSSEPPDPSDDDDGHDKDRASPATPDVLPGGAMVGLLERGGILAFLLEGSPEGVVLILAVKGVGRFGELRQPSAPERFIVGTLASVLWVLMCHAVIRSLLT